MNLTKKITQIFSLIFLGLFVASCDTGCVEADEFDTESVVIKSKPLSDGIYGTYDSFDGGQRAEWHDTGLKSNGEKFLISITGAWVAQKGSNMDESKLKNIESCFPNKLCAKNTKNPLAPNCICYEGQTPAAEKCPNGLECTTFTGATRLDCSLSTHQARSDLCTCTNDPQYGRALDYGVYHFPLSYYDKTESPRIADRQTLCKFDRGMGAYIGLFGSRGVDIPVRAYHLFSTEKSCNLVRNSNGECLDANGNDVTRYMFRSANSRIFMKDDFNGNNGIDNSTSNDTYHKPNEAVKVIMYDRYYSDNYGNYNITILRGVGNANDPGLIEFLVRLVEDTVLGKIDENGVRQGGIIEFMYKAIVQDTIFVKALQIALSLYIAFYGLAHLLGVAEINKKELMGRVLKIGLVILFTSQNSWVLYNQIVVSFFKDGMDFVVSMIMSLSDTNLDPTSMIKIAQMDRQTDISSATRFSYVDLVIKKLLSVASAKKIFGLFFGAIFFGMIYIPIIYALIAFFIYTMLFVASMYLVNVLKIVFVLALGPIFICFTLFKNTEGMFKKWLAFLGSRSLEIILIFAVLYNFLVIIDRNFTDLLSYRACVEDWGVGPVKLKILKSEITRSLMAWFVSFITIGGLIFITRLVVDKVPELAGQLISIGGEGSGTSGSGMDSKGNSTGSGTGAMAGNVMGGIMGLAKSAASKGFSVASTAAVGSSFGIEGLNAANGARALLKASGVAGAWNAAGKALPFRGLRSRARDSIIDGAISQAQGMAGGRTGAARDAFVRGKANELLMEQMRTDPKKMTLAGVNMDSVAARMDKQLVDKPLQDFLKAKAKELKSSGTPLLGAEMKNALAAAAKEWGEKNIVGGAASVDAVLGKGGMQNFMRNQGAYSTSEAAKSFAGNKDAQSKYMEYLQSQQLERDKKAKDSWKGAFGTLTGSADWLRRAAGNVTRDVSSNPIMAQENFMRKIGNEEQPRTWGRFLNPLSRINVIDKAMSYGKIREATDAANKKFMMDQLRIGSRDDDQKKRASLQRKLSDMASAGLQKDLKEIRGLQRSGKAAEAGKKMGELIKGVREEKGSLYDKMARLSRIHGQLGLEGEDPKLALSKAMQVELDKKLLETAALASKDPIEARKTAEELREMQAGIYGDGKGYEEVLKGVLDSLEERAKKGVGAAARASDDGMAINDSHDAMKDRFGQLDKALKDDLEKRQAAIDQAAKTASEAVAKISTGLESGTMTLAEARGEFVATSAKVEFGQSITDALLKGADVGLKAGNPFLGASPEGKKELDHAALQAIGIDKSANSGKAKMAKMDQKILEFELEALKKDPTKNSKEIAAVEAKIKEAKDDVEKFEREISKLETAEASIKGAV